MRAEAGILASEPADEKLQTSEKPEETGDEGKISGLKEEASVFDLYVPEGGNWGLLIRQDYREYTCEWLGGCYSEQTISSDKGQLVEGEVEPSSHSQKEGNSTLYLSGAGSGWGYLIPLEHIEAACVWFNLCNDGEEEDLEMRRAAEVVIANSSEEGSWVYVIPLEERNTLCNLLGSCKNEAKVPSSEEAVSEISPAPSLEEDDEWKLF